MQDPYRNESSPVIWCTTALADESPYILPVLVRGDDGSGLGSRLLGVGLKLLQLQLMQRRWVSWERHTATVLNTSPDGNFQRRNMPVPRVPLTQEIQCILFYRAHILFSNSLCSQDVWSSITLASLFPESSRIPRNGSVIRLTASLTSLPWKPTYRRRPLVPY